MPKFRRSVGWTVKLGLLLVVAACSGGDALAPVKPASVENAVGTAPSATVGTVLASAPTFVVKDAAGNSLSNISVTVAVTSGGGTLVGAPTKSSAGATSVGTWTLGTTAGTNVITVTVSGLSPLTLSATGLPGAPSKIVAVGGSGQSAPAGTVLSSPVVVKVTDQYGNGVSGQQTSFVVTTGGGTLTGALTATTDITGSAIAPPWKVGRTNVAQQLTVTSGTASLVVPATIATSYGIDLRYVGTAPEASIQNAFSNAIARITAMNVGAIQSVNTGAYNVDTNCGTSGVGQINEIIPSVIIYATIGPIDGPGKILGRAGPCAIRNTTKLPVIGVMTFDVADLQLMVTNGILDDVITHEMLHVLGFGSIWDPAYKNLIINAGTAQTAFTGAGAIAACQTLGSNGAKCTPTIPLEFGRGAGSDDSHWRETSFVNELMTPAVNVSPNPMSAMTIASMGDLGYTVNLAAADTYVLSSSIVADLSALRTAQGFAIAADTHDEVVRPTWSISRDGVIARLPRY